MTQHERSMTAEKIELASIADRVRIAPGVMMPRLGLGTWRAHGDTPERVVGEAIRLGYRLVDTSANYYNEEEVGRAIARSGVSREEIFLTTKLERRDQGYETTRPALQASLRRLGMDYVDLYIIHAPEEAKTEATWAALEECQQQGLTRSIGVSNFGRRDLDEVFAVAAIPPAVNQVELNPLQQRPGMQEYCRSHEITIEAWAPVIEGYASRVPELQHLAEKYKKTPAQVSLRWLLQKGMVAIPKTVHVERLRENADLYDFELTGQEMHGIDLLEVGEKMFL